MNHEDVIRIEHEDHLKEPSTAPLSLNEKLVIADLLGKRAPSLSNNQFRLVPIHAVLGDVIEVPSNPAEFHDGPQGIVPWIVPDRQRALNRATRFMFIANLTNPPPAPETGGTFARIPGLG